MSSEQGCLASAHRKEKSLTWKSVEIKSSFEGPEVIKEPHQDAEVTITGEITEVPEFDIESPQIDLSLVWKMFVDEAKNNLGARARVVLKSSEWAIFEHYLMLNFHATNNEAEYEGFIAGLQFAIKLKVHELHIFINSKLVVDQVTWKFKTRKAMRLSTWH